MTLETWWLYAMMTFMLSATPGPNMLLVMRSSALFGFRSSVATMAGCMSALLAMMCLSALGLGAVLQASPAVFNVLRWAGAAYLIYLGVKSWRSTVAHEVGDAATVIGVVTKRSVLYRRGLMVAASNPKAILFAAAFLPQFIHPQSPKLPQFAILLITFAVIESSWYLIYAGSGQRLASYLRRATVMKTFNRITGGMFVGFGGIMAAAHA